MPVCLSNEDLRSALKGAGFSLSMNRKEGSAWGTARRPRQTRWITIDVPASRMSIEHRTRRNEQKAERTIIREIEALVGKLDICESEMFYTDDEGEPVKGYVVAYIDTLN